jgi:uncharacterized protein
MKIHYFTRLVIVGFLILAGITVPALSRAAGEAKLPGHWEGAIAIIGSNLEIKVDFAGTDPLTGTIDIPQQGANGLALLNVTYTPPAVHFELPSGHGTAVFEGELGGDKIAGSFIQGSIEATFHLIRTELDLNNDTPTYTGTAVELETESGILYGTLDLPAAGGPWTLVVIQPGSGPTDRDGNSMLLPGDNNSLQMIGRSLADNGIAALRTDKRGVGKSVGALGSEGDLIFDHYIDDMVAWTELMRVDQRFSKIILLGHSEGSLIAMIAAQRTDVAGFISVAGAGRPIYDVISDQLSDQAPPLQEACNEIAAQLRQGKTVEDVPAALMSLFRPSVQPYMISWFALDPAVEIAKLKMPVLILQGDLDLQTKPIEAEKLISAKKDGTYHLIPGMNHVLKHVGTDEASNVAAYSDPDLPLADGLMTSIVAFIKKLRID